MLDAGALPQGATDSDTDTAAVGEPTTPATTVSGTVKLVDGTVIYLETEGGIVRVETGEATRTVTAVPANLADVVAGDQITVEGAQSDTALAATTITETAR